MTQRTLLGIPIRDTPEAHAYWEMIRDAAKYTERVAREVEDAERQRREPMEEPTLHEVHEGLTVLETEFHNLWQKMVGNAETDEHAHELEGLKAKLGRLSGDLAGLIGRPAS